MSIFSNLFKAKNALAKPAKKSASTKKPVQKKPAQKKPAPKQRSTPKLAETQQIAKQPSDQGKKSRAKQPPADLPLLGQDFIDLDLPEPLNLAIRKLNFSNCTPIQKEVLPHSLDGEDVIAQAAVLALFQSVVAGQGGNTASQNVAMAVRTLALEHISSRAQRRIIIRQLYMGFLLGLAVGSVVAVGVYLWRGNVYLSFVLGLALVANLTLGSLVGVMVPLGLERIGIDPALASSVLVTAATDSMGFFIFLSLAAHFLQQIR